MCPDGIADMAVVFIPRPFRGLYRWVNWRSSQDYSTKDIMTVLSLRRCPRRYPGKGDSVV